MLKTEFQFNPARERSKSMKYIKTMLFALVASTLLVTGSAQAERFVSSGGEVAIETIEARFIGSKKLIFYCASVKSCRAEEYTNEGDGKMKITFPRGAGNTVIFWKEGDGYHLDHYRKSDGKVTPWTLHKVQDVQSADIPDSVLFGLLPVGASQILISDGKLVFCPSMNCLPEEAYFYNVGDRLGYAGLFGNTLSILIGRLSYDEFVALNPGDNPCPKHFGNEMYMVSIHGTRNGKPVLDQSVFCSTGQDPKTTAAVNN